MVHNTTCVLPLNSSYVVNIGSKYFMETCIPSAVMVLFLLLFYYETSHIDHFTKNRSHTPLKMISLIVFKALLILLALAVALLMSIKTSFSASMDL